MHSLYTRMLLLVLLGTIPAGMAAAVELTLPMQQASTGNYYIHAILNDHVETELLVDTGSGYVSLTGKTFSRLKQDAHTRFQRHITGVMANGRAVSVPIYRIRELRLTEECTLRDIEVAVLRGASRDILGLNALKQLQPITLRMDPPQLISNSCQ